MNNGRAKEDWTRSPGPPMTLGNMYELGATLTSRSRLLFPVRPHVDRTHRGETPSTSES